MDDVAGEALLLQYVVLTSDDQLLTVLVVGLGVVLWFGDVVLVRGVFLWFQGSA